MPKPVCVKCASFMYPKRNGYPFLEMMPGAAYDAAAQHVIVPKDRPGWRPYKLWIGDLWACRHCDNEIVIGALSVVAEHYQDNFEDYCKHYPPQVRVNDC